jgi:hypothetical protein
MAPHKVRSLARTLLVSSLLLTGCRSATAPGYLVRVLEIAPAKVECYGVFLQECFQIRDVGAAEWELMFESIDGFSFEQGFSYVVRVERTTIENPVPDGPGYRWRLLELISRTPAS